MVYCFLTTVTRSDKRHLCSNFLGEGLLLTPRKCKRRWEAETVVSDGPGQQLCILGEAHEILQFRAGHQISWVGPCLGTSASRRCLVILGMACEILLLSRCPSKGEATADAAWCN